MLTSHATRTKYDTSFHCFQAPWVKVTASTGTIQIDSASVIDSSKQAPTNLQQDGVFTDTGGGYPYEFQKVHLCFKASFYRKY